MHASCEREKEATPESGCATCKWVECLDDNSLTAHRQRSLVKINCEEESSEARWIQRHTNRGQKEYCHDDGDERSRRRRIKMVSKNIKAKIITKVLINSENILYLDAVFIRIRHDKFTCVCHGCVCALICLFDFTNMLCAYAQCKVDWPKKRTKIVETCQHSCLQISNRSDSAKHNLKMMTFE